jgi:Glyoxalase/Bleomycin resistance protein/Dioxygenase superfamily
MTRKSEVAIETPTARTQVAGSSRRSFVMRSLAAMAAGSAATVLGSRRLRAQAPVQSGDSAPLVNLSGEKVVQISMAVKDAEKVAKRFSDIFGPSWKFYEFRPQKIVLHSKPQPTDCVLKLAVGTCGGHSFRLVQPISGPNPYSEFLDRHGEGFYSIGLGALNNYSTIVDTLANGGVGIELQGDIGNGASVTVLETAADLGCRIEFTGTPKSTAGFLKQTGHFSPQRPGIVDMDLPVMSGGRRFTQIGLVVKDDKYTAQRYQQLLGIGGWRFIRIPVIKYAMFGKALTQAELPSAEVGQGAAYLGDTQLELLAPVDLKPGGIHKAFLDRHGSGNGFQHLMISPAGGDHDAAVDALLKSGQKKEIEATIHLGEHIGTGDYIGMEEQVGGFVLEFNG